MYIKYKFTCNVVMHQALKRMTCTFTYIKYDPKCISVKMGVKGSPHTRKNVAYKRASPPVRIRDLRTLYNQNDILELPKFYLHLHTTLHLFLHCSHTGLHCRQRIMLLPQFLVTQVRLPPIPQLLACLPTCTSLNSKLILSNP